MKKIAIIGAGAAGLTAAYLLKDRAKITIFEKESYFGGHVLTISHTGSDGKTVDLDTGFMVFNTHTYPHLLHLFDALKSIQIGDSDMSFGYYLPQKGLQYAINFAMDSTFTRHINLSETLPPESMALYRKILVEFISFSKVVLSDLNQGMLRKHTLAEYFAIRGVSRELQEMYLIPMASAIWSTAVQDMLLYPAENLFRFFDNHGLLSLNSDVRWKYVVGGAKTYVARILEELHRSGGVTHLTAPVGSVSRGNSPISVTTAHGDLFEFDEVVFATHADEVLPILGTSATDDERAAFSKWRYQPNDAILHTDTSVMPSNKAAWASWNYVEEGHSDNRPLAVNYHLNRLQQHHTETQYFLSLNRHTPIPDAHIIRRIPFTHPMFSVAAVASQSTIRQFSGKDRIHYCGSYLGNGFHEDAVKSAFDMMENIR